MIGYRILNKSKPGTVLLIHGLFTTAGYWLSYLASLREFRLIILEIDYKEISDCASYVRNILDIIQTEAGGRVDVVIAHSLGTLISSQLPREARTCSFEICPVYRATRLNQNEFVSEIRRKNKFILHEGEIRSILRDVDNAVAQHATYKQSIPSRLIYLPDSDLYFSYESDPADKVFKGDHFDINEAFTDIRNVLSL